MAWGRTSGRAPWRGIGARHIVLLTLVLASSIGYADRAALGMVGSAVSGSLGFDAVAMGYILSASGISYLLFQVPGGILLDRFGSRWVNTVSIALFSFFTIAQGWVSLLTGSAAAMTLLLIRLGFGIACAPAIPANARITACWFPASERGFATTMFNSAQYFALVAFAPVMGWLAHTYGWPSIFYLFGAAGLLMAIVFPILVRSPLRHPLMGKPELDYIEAHGALVSIEDQREAGMLSWSNLRRIALHRQLLGLYLFQYCIGTLQTFFMTWFPIYLVEQQGLSLFRAGVFVAFAAAFGFSGNIIGGVASDALLRLTGSLTLARKLPTALGLICALSIVFCDLTTSRTLVIVAASAAFFGKGLAALGWTMVSDTSPKDLVGVTGGVFNMVANIAAVVSPIVIGHLVGTYHSFDRAIIFVALHCLLGLFALLVIVKNIARINFA